MTKKELNLIECIAYIISEVWKKEDNVADYKEWIANQPLNGDLFKQRVIKRYGFLAYEDAMKHLEDKQNQMEVSQ